METNSTQGTDKQKDFEYEVGIDEAGRGPVIGPMVYACCYWSCKLSSEMRKIGFKDSKKLTPESRRHLFQEIKEMQANGRADYELDIITAEKISNLMTNQIHDLSLNKISFESVVGLITKVYNKLNEKHKTKKENFHLNCYIDTVGPPEAYLKYFTARFIHYDIQFTVEEKADGTYPVVSAASICAKETRDDEMDKISRGEQVDMGCGYPHGNTLIR